MRTCYWLRVSGGQPLHSYNWSDAVIRCFRSSSFTKIWQFGNYVFFSLKMVPKSVMVDIFEVLLSIYQKTKGIYNCFSLNIKFFAVFFFYSNVCQSGHLHHVLSRLISNAFQSGVCGPPAGRLQRQCRRSQKVSWTMKCRLLVQDCKSKQNQNSNLT